MLFLAALRVSPPYAWIVRGMISRHYECLLEY